MHATTGCTLAVALIASLVSAQTFSEEDFFEDANEAFEESRRDEEEYLSFEWEGYDGWYNNPAHPDWGGAG